MIYRNGSTIFWVGVTVLRDALSELRKLHFEVVGVTLCGWGRVGGDEWKRELFGVGINLIKSKVICKCSLGILIGDCSGTAVTSY